ncbi:MAG: BlaI/MecI/CopY family transcriptional regulator [Planctomycetota bacterium]
MPRQPASQPTDVELEILQVLWDTGPATVRQVHDVLGVSRRTGYSTTLKMMQVMTDKGLLLKDASVRPQLYRPAQQQEQTQIGLLDDLLQRAFGGSARKMILRAAAAERITPEELGEIQELIDRADKGGSDDESA